eukprot:1514473-Rhodomonas_salina.1
MKEVRREREEFQEEAKFLRARLAQVIEPCEMFQGSAKPVTSMVKCKRVVCMAQRLWCIGTRHGGLPTGVLGHVRY